MNSEEFNSLLAKLRPVIGNMADAFWLTAILDPSRQEDIYAVAQAMASELLDESYKCKHILLEPPEKDKVNGEYTLGSVMYADRPVSPFGLRENDLPQHMAILGRSGAGKTNVGYLLVWNLLKKKKPFAVLDWRSAYSHFLNRPEGKEVRLFRLGEEKSLCFNILEPPANLNYNESEAYLRDIVSTVCTTYLPGHHLLSTRGVEYLMLKALDYFRAFSDKPVTSNDLRRYIDGLKVDSRSKDWKVSAQNILFKLTTGPVGRLLNGRGIATIPDILDRQVILELTGLGSETDRALFSHAFLLWLYYHRLAQPKSQLKPHLLLIEEAHNLFLRRHDGNSSINDVMMRQMRELKQCLILLDQNPSLMSVPSMANTMTSIVLNLKHADDVEAAGKSMTLPRKNWEYIGRLPVGHAIVKLQDRWIKPFLVRFPLFPVSNSFKASQAKRNHPGSDSVQQGIVELNSALNEAIRVLRDTDRKENNDGQIAPRERSLLLDIAKHPLSVVTERYSRLGWNAYTGNKIKRSLLEKDLIEQEKVSVPNGSVTLLKVTDKGRILLDFQGVKVKSLPKNASLKHEYWKKIIAEKYRNKDYEVEEEVPIGDGRAVDLVASKNGKRIAIEIETGKSDIEGNVKKCKEAGFDTVITISTPCLSSLRKSISR
jgi:hypothetical protein